MTTNESLMKRGAFGWTELMPADLGAACSFYGALFGWETEDYYAKGIKVSDEELAALAIERDTFHGEWNYRLQPRDTRD